MNEINMLQYWLDSGSISVNGLLTKDDIQSLINTMKTKAEAQIQPKASVIWNGDRK